MTVNRRSGTSSLKVHQVDEAPIEVDEAPIMLSRMLMLRPGISRPIGGGATGYLIQLSQLIRSLIQLSVSVSHLIRSLSPTDPSLSLTDPEPEPN